MKSNFTLPAASNNNAHNITGLDLIGARSSQVKMGDAITGLDLIGACITGLDMIGA